MPLTVHYLGAERYGVWLTISSLLTWMSMTDFGLAGNALINVLAEASGKDDREGAQHYSSSAFWALTGVGVVAGIVCLGNVSLHPWRAVFQVSAATSTHELQFACALTLGFLVLNFPLSMQQSIYSAYQDGFLANIWGIAANSLALLALVIVSRSHGGLPQLVLALSGTRAASRDRQLFLPVSTLSLAQALSVGRAMGVRETVVLLWAASTWSPSWPRWAFIKASR